MPTSFYLILGAAHSSRKALVADLIEHGFDANEHIVVYTANTEIAQNSQNTLSARANTVHLQWYYDSTHHIHTNSLNNIPTAIFFIADGYADPIDLLEVLPDWLQKNNLSLTRVITIINAQLLSNHQDKLRDWFDACLHFSDCALLTHTAHVSSKWLRDFSTHYQKQMCYPCLFENTKNNTATNPALILDSQARRMSLLFDNDEISDLKEVLDKDASEPHSQSLNKDIILFERFSDGSRKTPLTDIKAFLS